MAIYSTIPSIDPSWSDNTAPLNQTREQTREDLRRVLNLPVTVDALGDLTERMNRTAELSPQSVAGIEASLAEHSALESSRTDIQNKATWDGSAPLKKADVVEYDTSLLGQADAVVMQTQGINARMGQIEMEIRVALGYGNGGGARLYRS